MKKWTRKDKIMVALFITSIFLFVGSTYAWLSLTLRGKKIHTLRVAGLEITLDESMGEGINIEKAIPITDEEGKEGRGYTFTIKNDGLFDSNYQIYLDDVELENGQTRLEDQYVKYQLVKNEEEVGFALLSTTGENPNRLLNEGQIKKGVTDTYTLRLWLDYDAPTSIAGQIFKAQIRVEAVQVTDYQDVSGANAPVLADNMIPVVYNEANTRWEKADVTSEWYNYGEQMWANAVTATDASRSTYQNANAGEEVMMNDILQMYVWIPRYSYTIKSENGTNYYGKQEEGRTTSVTKKLPGEIDVKFVSSDTKEDGSAQYTGSDTPSEWFTPPGFTFGEKELTGLWVGKFETGYMGATSVSDTQKDTVEPNKAIIKPNVYSWQGIRVSTLDLVSRGVVSSGNIYGFDATYDSHAMKNSEWALVAYLSQSKYGKYGNSMYTGANKEIYINNNNTYLTGCSGGTPNSSSSSTCNQYDVITDRGSGKGALGSGASTAGTIYGVYDMNGGAYEYVMGNYNNYSGYNADSNSGYTGTLGDDGSSFTGRAWPESKYYNLYTTTNFNNACAKTVCRGYALKETTGWYGDYSVMHSQIGPWYVLGGYMGDETSGIYYYKNELGTGGLAFSFRLVLTPQ